MVVLRVISLALSCTRVVCVPRSLHGGRRSTNLALFFFCCPLARSPARPLSVYPARLEYWRLQLYGSKRHPYTPPEEQLKARRRHLGASTSAADLPAPGTGTTTPATTTQPPTRVINYGPCKPSSRPGKPSSRPGKHRHQAAAATNARKHFRHFSHLPKVISYERPVTDSPPQQRNTSLPRPTAPGKTHAAPTAPPARLPLCVASAHDAAAVVWPPPSCRRRCCCCCCALSVPSLLP